MPPKTPLALLHAEVDARVQAIREQHPEWLCCRGCGSCCRRLADVPQLTKAEWDLLREGLAACTPKRILDIRQNIAALVDHQSGPVVCPLLDRAANLCLIYPQRPVACRTYGFYVQYDQGLYCRDIESIVTSGTLADVVWGNHDAVDRRLTMLGETRALTDWFECWMSGR